MEKEGMNYDAWPAIFFLLFLRRENDLLSKYVLQFRVWSSQYFFDRTVAKF